MTISVPPTVGVIVITHRARQHLARCLPPLLASSLRPRVLVVNSSSGDGTVEEAERLGAQTLVVPRGQFNHGATRELARHHLGTPIVVMMTPDAYLAEASGLERLVAPVADGRASVAYGRQLPHPGAGFFESYPRRFNYGPTSFIRGLDDAPAHGVATFFCSDAFAAWSNAALDQAGGFPATLSHEDAIAAARLIRAGHRLAYVADAVVYHSHRYSLAQEFRRYFDAGYARAEFRHELAFAGRHGRLGRSFALGMIGELARFRPWLLPYAFAHIGAKWTGYRLGARAQRWPTALKARLSGQDYYWASIYYE